MRRSFVMGAVLLLSPAAALAEETQFICSNEDATNAIAEKLAITQEAADETAMTYITGGVCRYLPHDVHVDIIYRGKVFGDKDQRVQVVGFMDPTGMHMFYGMMPKDDMSF